MKKHRWIIWGVALLLPRVISTQACAASVPPDVEKAALQEDWKQVADLCAPANKPPESPVLSVLAGHACLALNRNNDSYAYFQSINNATGIAAWNEWTTALALANPHNAGALYLMGDALARAGKWQEAIGKYAEAIDTSGGHALALNARGVAYAQQQDFISAMKDFKEACKTNPELADAYANLATMYVIKESGKGALENFDNALKKSPEFALALNGRGCAQIGNSRDEKGMTSALTDFITAAKCDTLRKLAESNGDELRKYYVSDTSGDSETKKGTYLTADMLRNIYRDRGAAAARDAFHSQPEAHQRKIIDVMNRDLSFQNAINFLSGTTERREGHFSVNTPAGGFGVGGARDTDPSRLHSRSTQIIESITKTLTVVQTDSAGRYRPPVGGGDTAGAKLDQSQGDVGPWPVKTTYWGLFPGLALPGVK